MIDSLERSQPCIPELLEGSQAHGLPSFPKTIPRGSFLGGAPLPVDATDAPF
jgi:hypothetical protein